VLKKPIGRSLVKVYHCREDSRALVSKLEACGSYRVKELQRVVSQGITKGCKCPLVCNLGSNFLIVISLGLAALKRFLILVIFCFVPYIFNSALYLANTYSPPPPPSRCVWSYYCIFNNYVLVTLFLNSLCKYL
jgi:hypothetical protein